MSTREKVRNHCIEYSSVTRAHTWAKEESITVLPAQHTAATN